MNVDNNKMVSRSFTLPKKLNEALAEYAHEHGLYVSQVLRWAIQNYLQHASGRPGPGLEDGGSDLD